MQEEWRPVVGYEGFYEVSSLGRIKSLGKTLERRVSRGTPGNKCFRTYPQKIKPLSTHPDGYYIVNLCKGVRPAKTHRVHMLVLEAFVGPRPLGMIGLHADDNGFNNEVGNLRWGTYKDNSMDAKRNGLLWVGEKSLDAKLTEAQAQYALDMKGIITEEELAAMLNVGRGAINAIHRRKNWKHLIPPSDFATRRRARRTL